MPWQNRPGISPKKGEDTTTQPKTQLTKPSAGALSAAREILDTDHQLAAQIIDRETGVAELLEAAELAYVKLADISFQWPGRGNPEGQSLLCKLRDGIAKARGQQEEEVQNWAIQQAIAKAEGREEREKR